MKIVLVGMNNPYGADPKYALYPMPATSAGGRLFKMLRAASDGDLGMSEYARIFDRINLVSGDWDRRLAEAKATDLVINGNYARRRVVLLGQEVKNAFLKTSTIALPESHARWQYCSRSGAERWATLPHPSGRCRDWNDPEFMAICNPFFKGLVELARQMASEDA